MFILPNIYFAELYSTTLSHHFPHKQMHLKNCFVLVFFNSTNIHKCTLEQHAGWKKLRNHSAGCAQKVKISTKGSVPNIRYFVVNSRSSCFRRYLNNAFVEISTKGFILL